MQKPLPFPTPAEKHQLVQIEQGIHFSANTGTVYETTKNEVEPDALLQPGTTSGKPWARWGTDNNYPQRFIDTVSADPSATLLSKKRAMHYGKGLMFYKRHKERKGNRFEEIIEPIGFVSDGEFPNAEIEDFFWANDIDNFQEGIIGDFEWWERYAVQYVLSVTGKVVEVKWTRMKDVRPELRNPKTGKIDNYYLSGLWPDPQPGYYVKIPTFDRRSPRTGLLLHELVSIDKDYNPAPAWHGIMQWLHIARKVARWILANIDNSINLKYHVKIPLDYFLQRHPVEGYDTAEKRNEAIQKDESETFKKIDDFLTGEKNVHKNFYSKVAVGEDGKPLPGWEITAIPNDIKDTAWLNAYGTASMAITSGMGLSPSIGGQILPNGLGSGSGSDLREQFNFYMQVMTAQPRQTTLEWYQIVKRLNNWPKDIHLGYRDVILQSTDQAKSGFTKPNEEAPTTDKGDNNKTQP